MQAALMIRSKKRVARRKRLRKEGRLYDLPSNVSVKQLQPFPVYPPDQWVGDLDTSVKVFFSLINVNLNIHSTSAHSCNIFNIFFYIFNSSMFDGTIAFTIINVIIFPIRIPENDEKKHAIALPISRNIFR